MSKINDGVQLLLDGNKEFTIVDALDQYLNHGDTVRYLFPTQESKDKFKKQQLNIYYKTLQSEYHEIMGVLNTNVDNKKLVRAELQALKKQS